jgi:hypothetical protein
MRRPLISISLLCCALAIVPAAAEAAGPKAAPAKAKAGPAAKAKAAPRTAPAPRRPKSKVEAKGDNLTFRKGVPVLGPVTSVEAMPAELAGLVDAPVAPTSSPPPGGNAQAQAATPRTFHYEPLPAEVLLTPSAPAVGPAFLRASKVAFSAGATQHAGPRITVLPGGAIGVTIPMSAAPSSDLVVECRGSLPQAIVVRASAVTVDGYEILSVAEFSGLTDSIKFIATTRTDPTAHLSVSLVAAQRVPWTLSSCSVQRL